MKKIGYKLLVAIIFSVFGTIAKLLFSKNDLAIEKLIVSEKFWIIFIIFFGIGYVLLGNMLWSNAQKNKLNKD
tara:strand:+ start:24020 stop:24238 length:219 start_codon:yes stop_codon:yes gene_type:complete